MADRAWSCRGLMAAILAGFFFASPPAGADTPDRFDAALAHPGRPTADLQRDRTEHPADLLRLTGMKPGMTVLDMLAGNGYYSELASVLVGSGGRVLLVNNPAYDQWSDGLESRLANHRLPNVQHLTVDPNEMNLASNSVDVVLLVKVYHDLYLEPASNWPKIDVGAVLDQLAHALKPGGVLLLVDHSAKPGTGGADASSLHRIDEAFAIKDFEKHGFKVVARSEILSRPDDPRTQVSYKPPMIGKTDRFVMLLVGPKSNR